MPFKTPGQVAFEDFSTKHNGISPNTGEPLGSWEGQPDEKKEQWNAAALKFAVTRGEVKEALRESPATPNRAARRRRKK